MALYNLGYFKLSINHVLGAANLIDWSIKLRPFAYWPITTHCATKSPTLKSLTCMRVCLARATQLCKNGIGQAHVFSPTRAHTCAVDRSIISSGMDWTSLWWEQMSIFPYMIKPSGEGYDVGTKVVFVFPRPRTTGQLLQNKNKRKKETISFLLVWFLSDWVCSA